MKSIFKKGDKVFDILYGWGYITSIYTNNNYPIEVEFNNDSNRYTVNGCIYTRCKPTLSFTEYTLEGFSQEIPCEFEEGDWIAVSDNGLNWVVKAFLCKHIQSDYPYECKGKPNSKWIYAKSLTEFNKEKNNV